MLTSGELAEICQVSLRTVQYYDQKGLVKPSFISEGGRRMYQEAQVDRMRNVCMYRSLGFSLSNISTMLDEQDLNLVCDLIHQQIEKLREENEIKTQQCSNLELIIDAIHRGETVSSTDAFLPLHEKRLKFKHQQQREYIYITIFVVIEFMLFLIAQQNTLKMLCAIGIVVVLLGILIHHHATYNAYICPKCHTYFELTWFQDACSLNHGRKGKILTCPTCGRKGSFKEQLKK